MRDLSTSCIVLAALAAAAVNAGAAALLSRGPYIQLTTTHTACVVWRSVGAMTPEVRFGERPDQLDGRVPPARIAARQGEGFLATRSRPQRLSGAWANVYQYEARLEGLRPDTRYYYAVFDGSRRVAGGAGDDECRLRTAPLAGAATPVRFWVLGDSGTGGAAQASVYTAARATWTRERHEPDLLLHVGDIAYPRGRDWQFQERFFQVYRSTLDRTVCWPVPGNHECYHSKGTNGTGVGPYFDAFVLPTRGEAGGVASGTESFYAFDWGRVHFVALNTGDEDLKATGRMARWLAADLALTTAQAQSDWVVAFFHHAPFTKGSHDCELEKDLIEIRRSLVPVLEAGGVDLVLCGHSHTYERSMLVDGASSPFVSATHVVLDDGDGDPWGDGPYRKSAGVAPHRGTVYAVTGHGGASLGRKGTLPLMRRTAAEFGSLLVDIVGDTLTAVSIGAQGEVLDRFALVKRGEVPAIRREAPWQPVPWTRAAAEAGSASRAVPERYRELIPRRSTWRYLVGGTPAFDWTTLRYPDREWAVGIAPIGFGYPQCRTVLGEMRGAERRVHLRHEFTLEASDVGREVGLLLDYDDGFVAYVNGVEVARVNVADIAGKSARDVRIRPARGARYYPLTPAGPYLRAGRNQLAIEGRNASLRSGTFLLDPCLILRD